MTLREKILLAAMGAAVMGGGIQFGLSTLLPSPAPSGTDSSLQQARAVAGEVTARLQALPLSDGQRYILASSLRPAPRVYSGYVQAGKEALAIIGGLEYGVGDTLPNTGDVIRFIGSDGVRLYSPSRNAEWTLPYSGDDI